MHKNVIGYDLPASSGDVQQLRNYVDRLPDEYEALLKETDGCDLRCQLFAIVTPLGIETSVCLSLSAAGHVAETYEMLRGEIPVQSLPIARDAGGNQILLSCEPETFGQVFFWDHERGNPQQANDKAIADFANVMTPLADSLSIFLDEVLHSSDQFDEHLAQLSLDRLPMPPPPAPELLPPVQYPAGLQGNPSDNQVYAIEFELHSDLRLDHDLIHDIPVPETFWHPHSLRDGWLAPEVFFSPFSRVGARYLDIPYCDGRQVILRPSAVEPMRPLLDRFGELLPLKSDQGELFVFHCMNQREALDPDCYHYNESFRHLMLTNAEFRFMPDTVRGSQVFTVPQSEFANYTWFTRAAVEEFLRLASGAGISHPTFLMKWAAVPPRPTTS